MTEDVRVLSIGKLYNGRKWKGTQESKDGIIERNTSTIPPV